MDFSSLYDPRRQLFYIGYHVDEEKPDANYYDLLASEARIASLVAIAKGEVPQSHWLHLGRPLTQVDDHGIIPLRQGQGYGQVIRVSAKAEKKPGKLVRIKVGNARVRHALHYTIKVSLGRIM